MGSIPQVSGLVMLEPCGKGDMLSLLTLGQSLFRQDIHPIHQQMFPAVGKRVGTFHVTHRLFLSAEKLVPRLRAPPGRAS